jgi:ketosteroid isomerase-like protein
MSQANVEVVRRSFEGTARGDLAATLRDFDEDFEIGLPAEFPGATVGRGRDAWAQLQAQFEEAFRDIKYEPEEFTDKGDRVLATVRYTGHARHTGIPVDMSVYWLYMFSNGKIVRAEAFLDKNKALEAAGLQE